MEFFCHLPLNQAGLGSALVRKYVSDPESLSSLFSASPLNPDWDRLIEIKSAHFSDSMRKNLVLALQAQYGDLADKATTAQINSLASPKTFSLTTGHQLSFGTGPLFFIYKLVSVVRLAAQLKERYSEYHFVPIYWMNTEDHDLEEIRPLHLAGKTFTMPHEDLGQATGNYGTRELESVWKELESVLPNFPELQKGIKEIKHCYQSSSTLAEAIRRLVVSWTKGSGLLVLDQNDAQLKAAFAPIAFKDILSEQSGSLVAETTAKLEHMGFKGQVMPREINFFYHSAQGRKRMVRDAGGFAVLDTNLHFTTEALHEEFRQHPERFSPNVVTRPLYQETILPNLAYVGGPAEVHYWLQYKKVFEGYQIPFPLILARDSFLVIKARHLKHIQDEKIELADFIKSPGAVKEALVRKMEAIEEGGQGVDFPVGLIAQLENTEHAVDRWFADVDPGVHKAAKAAWHRYHKRLEDLNKKRLAALKKKHAHSLLWLQDLQNTVFPGQSLQERYNHVLSLGADPSFTFSQLLKYADPTKPGLKVLVDKAPEGE